MNETPLVIEQQLQAPIADVWAAITNPDRMKDWYFEIDGFKAEEGCNFSFVARSEDTEYQQDCEVLVCEPPSVLSYSWRYPDHSGTSIVRWELMSLDDSHTYLRLIHSGLDTFPQDNPDFSPESFLEGWNYFLKESLPAYLKGDTSDKETKETIEKETTIQASADVIWDIVLNPANQWALAFGEGTRVKTDWTEGSDVVWLDGDDQVCAYGVVIAHQPKEYLRVNMFDELVPAPGAEPGQYAETYTLTPVGDDHYRLQVTSGPLPTADITSHAPMWDKAVRIIKEMSEIR